MQIRGVLSKSGTTDRVDAALLVAEPGQAAGTLYLARADSLESFKRASLK